jgi:periplasmic copper chaperone A
MLAAMLVALAGSGGTCAGLDVTAAWIREAPPGAMMLAAYATLANKGDHALLIDGGQGQDFASVELHHTVVENGMSRMTSGHALALAPGARTTLAPGGWHLMLVEPRRALKAGDRVPLALSCGAGTKTFVFTVKADS